MLLFVSFLGKFVNGPLLAVTHLDRGGPGSKKKVHGNEKGNEKSWTAGDIVIPVAVQL